MDSVEVLVGDIRDPNYAHTAVKGASKVFNLAALIGIPYSFESPHSYVMTNIVGTLNLLEAARNNSVNAFVQTSTSEVYGTAKYTPMDESHALHAQSPYAATKIASDQLALSFERSFGMPVAVVRPFNTFGPRQSRRAVIPTIIGQILGGKSKLQLGDVSTIRDFTFVSDTAKGIQLAGEEAGAVGKEINLGTGYGFSISQIISIISEILEIEIEVVVDEERIRPGLSEVRELISSNELAKTTLGWNPEFIGTSGLRQGLVSTIEWSQEYWSLLQHASDRYNV
jgi:dTDP-glucose 4,6-dehydratase/UDP-glucose 4-epimerase